MEKYIWNDHTTARCRQGYCRCSPVLFLALTLVFASPAYSAQEPPQRHNLVVIHEGLLDLANDSRQQLDNHVLRVIDNLDLTLLDRRLPIFLGVGSGVRRLDEHDPDYPVYLDLTPDEHERTVFCKQTVTFVGGFKPTAGTLKLWAGLVTDFFKTSLVRFFDVGRVKSEQRRVEFVRRLSTAAYQRQRGIDLGDLAGQIKELLRLDYLRFPIDQSELPPLQPGESVSYEHRGSIEWSVAVPSVPLIPLLRLSAKRTRLRLDAPCTTTIHQVAADRQVLLIESHHGDGVRYEGKLAVKLPLPLLEVSSKLVEGRVERRLDRDVLLAFLVDGSLEAEETRLLLRGDLATLTEHGDRLRPIAEYGVHRQLESLLLDSLLTAKRNRDEQHGQEDLTLYDATGDAIVLSERFRRIDDRRSLLFRQHRLSCILGSRTAETGAIGQALLFGDPLPASHHEEHPSTEEAFLHCILDHERSRDFDLLADLVWLLSSVSERSAERLAPARDLFTRALTGGSHRLLRPVTTHGRIHLGFEVKAPSHRSLLHKLVGGLQRGVVSLRHDQDDYRKQASTFIAKAEEMLLSSGAVSADEVGQLLDFCRAKQELFLFLAMAHGGFDDTERRVHYDVSLHVAGRAIEVRAHEGEFSLFDDPRTASLATLAQHLVSNINDLY